MRPPSPNDIARLYREAVQRQSAGDLDGAEARLRAVLSVRPRQAEALFQMGRIALARGAAKRAVQHLDKAAEAKPGEPAIWLAYAQAIAALADKGRTRGFVKRVKAAKLPPDVVARVQDTLAGAAPRSAPDLKGVPPQEVRALVDLVNAGRMDEAEPRAAALRGRHPDVALLADIHANVQARLGQHEAARASFEEALRLDPDFAEARANYGRFLVETGAAAEGVAALRGALDRAPSLVPALLGLGVGLTRLGETDEAVEVLRRAADLQPEAVEPRRRLGQALSRAKDYAAAADAFGKAIDLGDRRAETHAAHAHALEHAGRPEAALAAHDAAVAAAPDRPQFHGLRAILLQQMGRFDEADAGFRRAIDLDPDSGESYRLMVKGRKLAEGDPLIAEMETLWEGDSLSDHSRMNLGFALAKAMEDTGRHDRIFAYLHPANALMRKLHPFDIAERRVEIEQVRAGVAGTDFARRQVAGTTDYAPIFVTGMPRSGTTLVEQIIASHSRVTGGGELGYLVPEAMRILGDGSGGLRPLESLSDDEIAGFGHKVEAHFRMRLPGAEIVTDKSIQTYMMAGLVRLALPRARIVVVHRDPRDTCLSIYKNIFAEGTHRYAYDLRDLGLYYRMFLDMVEFWRDRLPGGFHEIAYEDLIATPEREARALIAACGLEWEDACLDFHKTERRIATLSLHQVRQPIYASSMKAWERHAEELRPLIEALGDAAE
ncbi:Tetratricopeptide repeat-containing protein [Rhodovulum sp. ES.010]|uniref:tetratricopeptide repeat-containing sulfotransferase family protein n=1 Tax=Rhodovulum sp. ES.010 TaxID=1882821 RepID=UPI00092A77AE|nr:tetratricopeptide repeat-containing sulfotransferase family protein [Rhodovulum sp. ES.010]SIO48192.1 Tetratricopeptide repeat-containing protein [Rhodovulum sp. ES.010]